MMKRHLYRALFFLVVLAASCGMLAMGASAADPVSDFDFARYVSDNPDLMQAYGRDLYLEDLYLHYLNFGASEGRAAYSLRTGQPFVLEENAQQAYQTQQSLTGAEARIANATLTPDRNWPEPLLTVADQILAQVGGSTPYEQLRGCYDWLIQNCSYGSVLSNLNQGGWLAEDAYSIMTQRVGVCDNYSAAFAVLARMIGFDARIQTGQTHRAAGGYTGHAWCVINIHGVDYVFDPQVEDNIAADGAIRYLRFCKTYEEVPDKYILYAADVVQSNIIASGTVPAAYGFGQGYNYFTHINEARSAAGVSPMSWDAEMSRAALRIARGENKDTVLSELKSKTGKGYISYSSYVFYPSYNWQPNMDRFLESAGIGFYGLHICMLYSIK
ncbi:transglutaminase domain-containing protein [Faecalibacterium sp. An122]|uniref:transglutaminase domain-containing protein n=1 Tax=Faecalibacterium sp. An122 TaxID=1965551 RepID=UPI000B39AF43|nr:transglutaminase domain-containing protein [Faecalibacterium sp. An122]OUQ38451.1 hypothetical protein B5E67_05540 [Faecalibacterium sp. An122]